MRNGKGFQRTASCRQPPDPSCSFFTLISPSHSYFLTGGAQLAFTCASLLLSFATYFSPRLAMAWQAVKFLVPLYFGAQVGGEGRLGMWA